MIPFQFNMEQTVHCRVGSLENDGFACAGAVCVHCRVGSLEKNFDSASLPAVFTAA